VLVGELNTTGAHWHKEINLKVVLG